MLDSISEQCLGLALFYGDVFPERSSIDLYGLYKHRFKGTYREAENAIVRWLEDFAMGKEATEFAVKITKYFLEENKIHNVNRRSFGLDWLLSLLTSHGWDLSPLVDLLPALSDKQYRKLAEFILKNADRKGAVLLLPDIYRTLDLDFEDLKCELESSKDITYALQAAAKLFMYNPVRKTFNWVRSLLDRSNAYGLSGLYLTFATAWEYSDRFPYRSIFNWLMDRLETEEHEDPFYILYRMLFVEDIYLDSGLVSHKRLCKKVEALLCRKNSPVKYNATHVVDVLSELYSEKKVRALELLFTAILNGNCMKCSRALRSLLDDWYLGSHYELDSFMLANKKLLIKILRACENDVDKCILLSHFHATDFLNFADVRSCLKATDIGEWIFIMQRYGEFIKNFDDISRIHNIIFGSSKA